MVYSQNIQVSTKIEKKEIVNQGNQINLKKGEFK
jgi:hypothetical protein